jgi:hypothetical protein
MSYDQHSFDKERGREVRGSNRFLTQLLLLPIYKREGGAEIERDVVTCTFFCLPFNLIPQKR